MSSQSPRVAYVHSEELIEAANTLPANVGRHRLAHKLIRAHGLLELAAEGDELDQAGRARAYVVEPIAATREELIKFHDERFVDTLLGLEPAGADSESGSESDSDSSPPAKLTPASFRLVSEEDRPAKRRKVDHMGLEDDCPMFSELSEYVQLVAGASIQAARELRDGRADVAIAWTGGRHHGRRGEAAGFCYVQDVVLAILELRLPPKLPPPPSRSPSPSSPQLSPSPEPASPPIQAPHPIRRVLYLDIDLHHGDGVESAFYTSPHTLTLSLHLHAPLFYPSTGSLSSTGPTPPKGSTNPPAAAHHALNLALHPGLSTPTLLRLFDSCVQPIYDIYQPDAVVLQCGCDGLAGDPCKEWNLDLGGMGEVVRRVVHGWGKRTLLLGGGGYDNANAARCWTYLTSVALDRPLPLDTSTPPSLEPDDYALFAPSFTLDVPAGHKPDLHTEAKLVEVEDAFKGYAEALAEKYGKRKELAKVERETEPKQVPGDADAVL